LVEIEGQGLVEAQSFAFEGEGLAQAGWGRRDGLPEGGGSHPAKT